MPNTKKSKRDFQEVDADDVAGVTVTNITSQDGSDIKRFLEVLSSKMDSLNNCMSEVDQRMDVKINNLESSLSTIINGVKDAMDLKLASFSTDFEQRLKVTAESCNQRSEIISNDLSAKLRTHVDEACAVLDFRIDKLERLSRANEIIISGVPIENNDDPWRLLGDICQALNCNLNERDFAAVYRIKSSSNSGKKGALPIIARLYSDWAVRDLFSCYFKKGNLNLADIGFKSNARIFINESLTKSNREIFRLAVEAKKAEHVVKVNTRNGLVYVQRCAKSKPMRIHHIGELQQILPPLVERAANSVNRRRQNIKTNSSRFNVSGSSVPVPHAVSPSVSTATSTPMVASDTGTAPQSMSTESI